MTEQLSHGFFILAAYGVTLGVVGGLLVWLVIVGRVRKARVAALTMHDKMAGGDKHDAA